MMLKSLLAIGIILSLSTSGVMAPSAAAKAVFY
jgi:hypothetical protein